MSYEVKYDVFLSFSSKDSEIARRTWESLTSEGVRVFWSDETLKSNAGKSFVSEIEDALLKSNHFILLCTKNSMSSPWVREEYESFFSHCYLRSDKERRLVIYAEEVLNTDDLPLMLRNIQQINNPDDLIDILGRDRLGEIKDENGLLKQELETLKARIYREISDKNSYQKVVGEKDKEIFILNNELNKLKNSRSITNDLREDSKEDFYGYKKEINNKDIYIDRLEKTNLSLISENERSTLEISSLMNEKVGFQKNYNELLLILDQQNYSIKELKSKNEKTINEKNNESDLIKADLIRRLDESNYENLSKKSKIKDVNDLNHNLLNEKNKLINELSSVELKLKNSHSKFRSLEKTKKNLELKIENLETNIVDMELLIDANQEANYMNKLYIFVAFILGSIICFFLINEGIILI